MKNWLALGGSLITLFFVASASWAEAVWKSSWTSFLYALGVWALVSFSAHGIGRFLLDRIGVPFAAGPERLVLNLGIGYGALGYLVLWGGIMNCLIAPLFWIILSFLVFFSLQGRPKSWKNDLWGTWNKGEKCILCLLGFLALIHLFLSFAPPTGRDVLTQHLALPKLYVLHHGIYSIPFAEASFNPMQVDMLYTLALLLKSEEAASLIHGTFAFMTGALILFFLQRHLPRWLALMGSLLFLSTPLVVNLSSKAYVDLGLVFFSFGAIFSLTKMEETRRWAIFSAIFAGLAAATKYNGLLVLLLVWAWFLLAAQNQKPPFSFKEKIGYLLIALAMVLPWTLRNFFYAGNPLFPFFSEWVGNITPVEQYPLNPLTRRALLYGEGWSDFLTIPVRIFFQGQDDIPRYFDGVLNPIFLLLSPLAFVGAREGWRVRMAGFVILYFLFSLFLVDMRARYILPTLAPLTVLSVLGLARLRSFPWGKVWVASSLALLVLNFFYLQDFLRRADHALYLLGKESKEAYLSRTLSDYDLWRYANRHLPVDAKVMMYFLGNRGYYCDREYIYDSYYSGKRLNQVLSRSPSAERLVEYFRGLRITHIALRKDLFDQFSEANLLLQEKEAWREFLTRHLQLLYEGKGYQLYQVQGGLDASGV